MKKIILSLSIAMATLALSAQKPEYTIQRACHPEDVKHYDTEQIRSRFAMPEVMKQDKVLLTYSMYDRLVFGGAMPVTKEIVLETIEPLKSEYFLERRELGVINIGGDGIVTVDGKEYELHFKDALYVGRGNKEVKFRSKDSANPAKFYLNSTTAHKAYKTQLITIDGRKGSLKANSFAAGKMEESNDRVINQLIVNNVLEEGPCQLQMGLTELKPGSVWNTMWLTLMTAVWRHISTSMCRKATPFATSWASLRKTAWYGFTTSRRSCRPNGRYMQPPGLPTTCLSGEWVAKTSTTATWTRSHILK